jgi:hypothetical protein
MTLVFPHLKINAVQDKIFYFHGRQEVVMNACFL